MLLAFFLLFLLCVCVCEHVCTTTLAHSVTHSLTHPSPFLSLLLCCHLQTINRASRDWRGKGEWEEKKKKKGGEGDHWLQFLFFTEQCTFSCLHRVFQAKKKYFYIYIYFPTQFYLHATMCRNFLKHPARLRCVEQTTM